jgi:hypothetical protein
MERLVTLDTAGLSDDALHVLNLSLAAAEGTELERMLAFGSSVICWSHLVRTRRV